MPNDRGTNLHRALTQYNSFFRDLTESLIHDALEEMRVRMWAAGWHQKVIDNLRMTEVQLDENTGAVSGKILYDYKSTRTQPDGKQHEFNVSEGMEEGTEPHTITARWAPLLRWIDMATGQLRSAIEVFNPGMGKGRDTDITKLGIIHSTRDEMEPKMQAILDSASTQFLILTINGQPLPQTWYNRGDLT